MRVKRKKTEPVVLKLQSHFYFLSFSRNYFINTFGKNRKAHLSVEMMFSKDGILAEISTPMFRFTECPWIHSSTVDMIINLMRRMIQRMFKFKPCVVIWEDLSVSVMISEKSNHFFPDEVTLEHKNGLTANFIISYGFGPNSFTQL